MTKTKYSPIKSSHSVHSIDISKPEGITSFWNLISNTKKNKDLLNVSRPDNEKQIKPNGVALKVLKLKGINLSDVCEIEKINFDAGTLNKKSNTVITDLNQSNLHKKDVTKKNILFNLLNTGNQRGLWNEEHCSHESTLKTSTGTTISKKDIIKSTLLLSQPKNQKLDVFTNKKGIKENEEYNNTFNSIFQKNFSEKVLFKSDPTGKLKKIKHKTVFVPVYIGKTKSQKSNYLEKEALLSANEQNKSLIVSSLFNRVKELEERLQNLQAQRKINIDTGTLKTSQKLSCTITNSRPNLDQHQFEEGTLISNKAKTNNLTSTNLHWIKKYGGRSNEIIKNHKTIEKEHLNIISSGEYSESVYPKRDENVDDLYDPDILLKNHKLIIPRDLSEESLFRANPNAGCDTILKLYKVLSEDNKSKNQCQNISIMGSNIKDENEVRDFYLKNNTKHEVVPYNLCNKTNTCVETVYESSMKKHNIDETKDKLLNTFSQTNHQSMGCNKTQIVFRNIFSLPMNMDIRKPIDPETSDETNMCLFKEEAETNTDIFTTSSNDIEEQPVNTSVSKNHSNVYLKQASENSQTSLQNQETTTTKTVINDDNFQNESLELPIETEEIIDLDGLKSCEGRLSLSTESLSQQLKESSSTFREKVTDSHDCYDSEFNDKSNTKVKYTIDKVALKNIHEQDEMSQPLKSHKLFKKTTISCPARKPDKDLSITILIENNIKGGNILSGKDSNLEAYFSTQFREVKTASSALELRNSHPHKEYNDNKNESLAEDVTGNSSTLPYEIESILSISKDNMKNNTNSTVDCNQFKLKEDNFQKADRYGLTCDVAYLNKDQRRVFDKKILGKDNYEKTINLSRFKLNQQYQKVFTDPNHKSGFINILSESSTYIQKDNVVNQCKLKTQYKILRSRRHYPKSPYNLDTYIRKKHLKSKVLQKHKISYRKQSSHPSNIFKIDVPSEKHDFPSLQRRKDEWMNNQSVLKTQILCTNLQGPKRNSASANLEEMPCKFGFTLNQESVVRQTNDSLPSYEMSEGVCKTEASTIFKPEQHCREYGHNGLNVIGQATNNVLVLLKNSHINCSQTKDIDHVDLKTIRNSQTDCCLCDAKLVKPTTDENVSILTHRLLEKVIGLECEIDNNHSKTQKSNLQCKPVNNRGTRKSCHCIQEHKNNQQSIFQRQIAASYVVLNHVEHSNYIGIENNYNNSFHCDSQLISQNTDKTRSLQDLINKPRKYRLQCESVENEMKNETNKTTFCNCCVAGSMSEIPN